MDQEDGFVAASLEPPDYRQDMCGEQEHDN